eukprot:scaffold441_cov241-Pinguiococcus_pyrenoidosus.AAC.8
MIRIVSSTRIKGIHEAGRARVDANASDPEARREDFPPRDVGLPNRVQTVTIKGPAGSLLPRAHHRRPTSSASQRLHEAQAELLRVPNVFQKVSSDDVGRKGLRGQHAIVNGLVARHQDVRCAPI